MKRLFPLLIASTAATWIACSHSSSANDSDDSGSNSSSASACNFKASDNTWEYTGTALDSAGNPVSMKTTYHIDAPAYTVIEVITSKDEDACAFMGGTSSFTFNNVSIKTVCNDGDLTVTTTTTVTSDDSLALTTNAKRESLYKAAQQSCKDAQNGISDADSTEIDLTEPCTFEEDNSEWEYFYTDEDGKTVIVTYSFRGSTMTIATSASLKYESNSACKENGVQYAGEYDQIYCDSEGTLYLVKSETVENTSRDAEYAGAVKACQSAVSTK